MKIPQVGAALKSAAIGIVIPLFVWPTSALADQADFSRCPQFFAGGSPPVIQATQDLKQRALCFDNFAVLYSGVSRTPIYVAERLNRAIVEKQIERSQQFHEEERLPETERATLEDYIDSGYDRGHMAPAADMDTPESMDQSFSLANVVPQSPVNNKKIWAKIERDTRRYVMRAKGDVYVITGPIFDRTPPTIGYDKVWVPKYLFKMVYDPATGRSWAYWLENSDSVLVTNPISYDEIVSRTGIALFPTLGH